MSAQPTAVLAFGETLADYARQTKRTVLISWLGGEPLRWPPLFEISAHFKHALGLRISATTNGTALASTRVREHLLADFDELTLSLDAADSWHEQMRGAPGLLARLEHALAELNARKAQLARPFKLRVNAVLMRDNVQQLEAIGRRAAQWGAETLTFNALGGRDRPEFFPTHSLQLEQIAWLKKELPGLRARLQAQGVTLLGQAHYLDRLAQMAQGTPWRISDCAPGQSFLFINEHGLISPCSFTSEGYGLPLADIQTVNDLIALPQRFTTQQQARLLPPCYDCPSTQVFGKFETP